MASSANFQFPEVKKYLKVYLLKYYQRYLSVRHDWQQFVRSFLRLYFLLSINNFPNNVNKLHKRFNPSRANIIIIKMKRYYNNSVGIFGFYKKRLKWGRLRYARRKYSGGVSVRFIFTKCRSVHNAGRNDQMYGDGPAFP